MHQNNKFTESGLRFAHHNKKEDFCLLPLKSLSVVLSSEKGFVLVSMDQSSLEYVLGTPVLAGSRRRVKGIAMLMPRYDQHQWHAQLIHSRVEMAQLCTFFFLCLILQVLFVFCWVMVSSVTYDLCGVRHAVVLCGVESRLPSAPRCNCRETSAKPFVQAVSRSCPRHAG